MLIVAVRCSSTQYFQSQLRSWMPQPPIAPVLSKSISPTAAITVQHHWWLLIVWPPGWEEGRRWWDGCKFVKRWCCSTHVGSEVSCRVGGCGGIFVHTLGVFWCSDSCVCVCSFCGIACGLPVAGVHLIENGGPWGIGWCWCGYGLAPPFWSSFRSIKSIKWTLPALAATPLWHRQLNGRGYTSCTSLMSLIWFRCPMFFFPNFKLITLKRARKVML